MTRDALAALFRVDPADEPAMLGALLLGNALVNIELIATVLGKKSGG